MNRLKELYAQRDTFLKWGAEVPQKLLDEIADAERAATSGKLLDILEENLPHTLPDIGQPVNIIVVAEYIDNSLTRIAFDGQSTQWRVFDICHSVRDIKANIDEDESSAVEEPGAEDDGIQEPQTGIRSKSIPFEVRFGDGKTIFHTNAQRTMIEALKYMGLERVAHFSDEDFKGFRLVDKRQRITDEPYIWQKFVDGWWVYINMTNPRKIRCLQGLSKYLNIPLQIIPRPRSEADLFGDSVPVVETKGHKGKRALNSLNGSLPMAKNRSVLATVKLLLQEFPSVSFQDVLDMFPKELQGSYGVVRTLDDIERRKHENRTEGGRWFLDQGEILTAADGTRFAVSTEWGLDNYVRFQHHINDSWGWTLEQV